MKALEKMLKGIANEIRQWDKYKAVMAKYHVPFGVAKKFGYTPKSFSFSLKKCGIRRDFMVSDVDHKVRVQKDGAKLSLTCPGVIVSGNIRQFRPGGRETVRISKIFLFGPATPESLDKCLSQILG